MERPPKLTYRYRGKEKHILTHIQKLGLKLSINFNKEDASKSLLLYIIRVSSTLLRMQSSFVNTPCG